MGTKIFKVLPKLWFAIWLFLLFAIFMIGLKSVVFLSFGALLFLPGHLLFFTEANRTVFRIVQILNLLLFLLILSALNAEGTTWGGPSYIGWIFLIPVINSFIGAAKSFSNALFDLYASVFGIFGILYCLWRKIEISKLSEENRGDSPIYWAPSLFDQKLGMAVSVLFLIFGIGFLIYKRCFFKNSQLISP